MSGCPALSGDGANSIAEALRVVDCRTGEATAAAFGRLFGTDGRLLPALTLILTLYIAWFAIGLLTGRSRIGLSSLTPRMMTLGLVLTFATSWAAYQGVVWNLASGAPDQVATLLVGSNGSATTAFADRLDQLFSTVAEAAHQASVPAPPTETGITPATPMVGTFTASTVLWLSATMMLLGTVGVLLTSKIALAALLALGPLFVTFALFRGTRGLFEGWLKASVLFAIVPLLAVLIGGGAIELMAPLVRGIAMAGSQPEPQQVAAVFLAACVFVALMVITLKTAGTLVSGWRIGGSREAASSSAALERTATAAVASSVRSIETRTAAAQNPSANDRVRAVVAALPAPREKANGSEALPAHGRRIAAAIASSPQALLPRRVRAGGGTGGDNRVQALRGGYAGTPVRITKEHVS